MLCFNIGDLVAFQTSPFFQGSTDIILSGDAMQNSPLLVITEVLQKKLNSDEDSDEREKTVQYKCIWFSTRNNRFQEVWLYHYQLKLIFREPQDEIQEHELVNLKTLDYELGKTKSSFSTDENEGKGSTLSTSLLSFLAPIMQVREFVNEDTQAKGRQNSGKNTSLLKSKRFAKCLWYEPSQDKFSEILLPVEALQLVPKVDEEHLKGIRSTIVENKKYLHYNKDSINSVFKPRNITSRSGRYYLRGHDYIQNKMIEFELWNGNFTVIDTPFKRSAPKFDHDINSIITSIVKEVVDLINVAIQNSSYIRLQYKNRNDHVTVRTISECNLNEQKEGDVTVLFLSGYCFLRKERRTFRVDKIQNIQELVLSYKS